PIKEGSLHKLLIVFSEAPMELGILFSRGNVSCSFKATIVTITRPTKAKKRKILFQLAPSNESIVPPAIEATIGATALITINKQKNLGLSLTLKTSLTTARDRTAPAEAVNPCRNRAAINTIILGANAHKIEVITKLYVAINIGFLLPCASLIGPITN